MSANANTSLAARAIRKKIRSVDFNLHPHFSWTRRPDYRHFPVDFLLHYRGHGRGHGRVQQGEVLGKASL